MDKFTRLKDLKVNYKTLEEFKKFKEYGIQELINARGPSRKYY